MKSARDLTVGAAVGAALMFLFDPRGGGARRATVRQKSTRAAHELEAAAGIGMRDLQHRLRGIAALAFGKRRPARAPGRVLVARVRAKLGRVCSHPHAIEVIAKGEGVVELRGPILREEAAQVLSCASRVRGVRSVEDALDLRDTADVPALQGGARRSPARATLTPATRFVLGMTAAGFSLASLVRGSPLGMLAGGAAAVGLARSIVHRGGAGLRRPLFTRAPQVPVQGLREAYPPGSEWAPSPASP